MSGPARSVLRICALGLALALTVTACTGGGDLNIVNDGADVVEVATGDQELELSAHEGVVILHYGCTPGHVTVEFRSGRRVAVAGPVCPEQRIVVGDEGVHTAPVEPPPA